MYKTEVVLKNEAGLHARPASLFVKEATKYNSEITVLRKEAKYNGKSIMGILSMGAVQGDLLTIMADGSDEKDAAEALKRMVDSDFGE